jgi:hypothetical protein
MSVRVCVRVAWKFLEVGSLLDLRPDIIMLELLI